MPAFDPNRLITGVVQILIVLFGVSLREGAKAWMAERYGDSTARSLGRVSLNPQRHFDFFGSFLLPLLMAVLGGPVFGYGRPVPLTPANLRHPRRDEILISLIGPAANIGLALAATMALTVALAVLGAGAQETALVALQFNLLPDPARITELVHFPLLFTLVQMAYLNAFLAVFHLLPLPPLDGGQIFLHMLPPDWSAKYAAVRPYGVLIATVLAVLRVVTFATLPVFLVLSLLIQLGD
jgi:Zn-dependent protease